MFCSTISTDTPQAPSTAISADIDACTFIDMSMLGVSRAQKQHLRFKPQRHARDS